MKELAVGIELFENIFTESYSEIQKIPDFFWKESVPPSKAGRHSYVASLNGDSPMISKIKDLFDYSTEICLNEYTQKYKTEYLDKESAVILRYEKGHGFSDHIDDSPRLSRRRISMTYYINDNYSGGEIEFPRFNLKIKPKAGNLLVFPSSYAYNHIVHPVEDGIRYSIAQFLC